MWSREWEQEWGFGKAGGDRGVLAPFMFTLTLLLQGGLGLTAFQVGLFFAVAEGGHQVTAMRWSAGIALVLVLVVISTVVYNRRRAIRRAARSRTGATL